ncbi:MAG: hypothetical protein ACI9LO_002430 [Planctomycetota bacterium]|jgi:hypothetical protein
MRKHIIILVFLQAEILFYVLGPILPAVALLGIGILAEGVVWMRLVRGFRQNKGNETSQTDWNRIFPAR